jgi:hypothetical protein
LQGALAACQADGTSVDALEELRNIRRHQIDHLLLQGYGGLQAYRLAHRPLGPVGIAAAHLGQPADVGHRVIDEPVLHGASVLVVPIVGVVAPRLRGAADTGQAIDLNRGCCAQVGGRSHGGHMTRVEDVGTGAGRAGPGRRYEGDYWDAGSQDRLDDPAHGLVQAARSLGAILSSGRVSSPHESHPQRRIQARGRYSQTKS